MLNYRLLIYLLNCLNVSLVHFVRVVGCQNYFNDSLIQFLIVPQYHIGSRSDLSLFFTFFFFLRWTTNATQLLSLPLKKTLSTCERLKNGPGCVVKFHRSLYFSIPIKWDNQFVVWLDWCSNVSVTSHISVFWPRQSFFFKKRVPAFVGKRNIPKVKCNKDVVSSILIDGWSYFFCWQLVSIQNPLFQHY